MEKLQWVRTDLLDESEEFVQHRTHQQKEKLEDSRGISIEEFRDQRVIITRVDVSETGEQEIGKKSGSYITLTIPTLFSDDEDGFVQMENALVANLQQLHEKLKLTSKSKILVIGLGNRIITPDAVGPLTIDELHNTPSPVTGEEGQFIVYAPGVTGQSGYETSEFVQALSEQIKPDLILVVDALASRASSRLCKTVQLTNTGIHPGSGVGNERKEISESKLGFPVTAIGIPTVVDGPVLIADAVETVFRSIASKINERGKPSSLLSVTPWQSTDNQTVNFDVLKPIFGEWSTWSADDRRKLFEEILTSSQQRLFVTPKDVDIWISQYAQLIGNSIVKWLTKHVFMNQQARA